MPTLCSYRAPGRLLLWLSLQPAGRCGQVITKLKCGTQVIPTHPTPHPQIVQLLNRARLEFPPSISVSHIVLWERDYKYFSFTVLWWGQGELSTVEKPDGPWAPAWEWPLVSVDRPVRLFTGGKGGRRNFSLSLSDRNFTRRVGRCRRGSWTCWW